MRIIIQNLPTLVRGMKYTQSICSIDIQLLFLQEPTVFPTHNLTSPINNIQHLSNDGANNENNNPKSTHFGSWHEVQSICSIDIQLSFFQEPTVFPAHSLISPINNIHDDTTIHITDVDTQRSLQIPLHSELLTTDSYPTLLDMTL